MLLIWERTYVEVKIISTVRLIRRGTWLGAHAAPGGPLSKPLKATAWEGLNSFLTPVGLPGKLGSHRGPPGPLANGPPLRHGRLGSGWRQCIILNYGHIVGHGQCMQVHMPCYTHTCSHNGQKNGENTQEFHSWSIAPVYRKRVIYLLGFLFSKINRLICSKKRLCFWLFSSAD